MQIMKQNCSLIKTNICHGHWELHCSGFVTVPYFLSKSDSDIGFKHFVNCVFMHSMHAFKCVISGFFLFLLLLGFTSSSFFSPPPFFFLSFFSPFFFFSFFFLFLFSLSPPPPLPVSFVIVVAVGVNCMHWHFFHTSYAFPVCAVRYDCVVVSVATAVAIGDGFAFVWRHCASLSLTAAPLQPRDCCLSDKWINFCFLIHCFFFFRGVCVCAIIIF